MNKLRIVKIKSTTHPTLYQIQKKFLFWWISAGFHIENIEQDTFSTFDEAKSHLDDFRTPSICEEVVYEEPIKK